MAAGRNVRLHRPPRRAGRRAGCSSRPRGLCRRVRGCPVPAGSPRPGCLGRAGAAGAGRYGRSPAGAGWPRPRRDPPRAALCRLLFADVNKLRRYHRFVAATAQSDTQELLGMPLAEVGRNAVLLGGVEEVDPEVERGVDDPSDSLLVARAAEEIRAEVVAADADDRDVEDADPGAPHRGDRSAACDHTALVASGREKTLRRAANGHGFCILMPPVPAGSPARPGPRS